MGMGLRVRFARSLGLHLISIRYGAFRVGSHDDLVTALGLAVQAEPLYMFIGRADPRLPYLKIPV